MRMLDLENQFTKKKMYLTHRGCGKIKKRKNKKKSYNRLKKIKYMQTPWKQAKRVARSEQQTTTQLA